MRLCGVGTIFYDLNLTLTLTVLLPSMNLALNRYRAISRKISFAENLRNLALMQPGESRSDEVVQEHISAALIGPPRISSDYLVKEAEEEMHFADALTSFNQPPLTKTDLLLEKELLGRPISLRESNYTPAIAASPFYISHFNSALWVVRGLGVSKDNSFFKNIRLEKGSPLCLFDLDLARLTLGYDAPTLFCTIDYFLRDELGFMIAKADTHLFTRSSKYVAQIPPFFIIAIPKHLVHPGDRTYTSNEATFGQHFYQKGSGKHVCQLPPRAWEGDVELEVFDEGEIEWWYQQEQKGLSRQWRRHWKTMSSKDEEWL
jgi:hypothetical protein